MRHKQLPHASGVPQTHWMASTIPVVEVADHAGPARIRCPDRKTHTVHTVDVQRMRAEQVLRLRTVTLRQSPERVFR
jgi:hypothetical protein